MMRPAVLVVLGAAAAALLYGCAPPRAASIPSPPPAFLAARPDASARPPVIGVLVNGWHSGLILPAEELGPLGPLLPHYADERYVSFGWGNRRFYMSPHPTLFEGLAALFGSPSVVLVQGAPTLHALVSGAKFRWLCADREEVWKVDAYLSHALSLARGKPVRLGAGLGTDSAFYASGERYGALHTCNTWTADALESAGLPVHASDVIFSDQLEYLIGKLPACTAAAPPLPHRALTRRSRLRPARPARRGG